MARQITTIHLVAAVTVAAIVGVTVGSYIGHRRGIVEGYLQGAGEGFARGSDAVLAQTLANTSRSAPGTLVRSAVEGFRRGLQCPSSLAAAKASAQSADPRESVRGTQCSTILAELDKASGTAQ